MNMYNILISILDRIRQEAPAEYLDYYPNPTENEKIINARSKAFIHLFLKAKFGLISFDEREQWITDGSNDGGIDGFYIDAFSKVVYFIQAKFRANEKNFIDKEIKLEEILKMDIDRILRGETTYENGNSYNSKILSLQRKINSIPDIAKYRYEVMILANLKRVSETKIRSLVSGLPCTIFDYKKSFSDLVFPVLSGTFYYNSDLLISLNLNNKNTGTKINYFVDTEYGPCDITVLFVPIIEVGRIMSRYKNSILKYNPRSYLTLKEGNINSEIRNTVILKNTNEFALFNNGITMLSNDTYINERIGQKDKAILSITNPQIINGGQTAYTLSIIYEEAINGNNSYLKKIENKEVLLKIITINPLSNISEENKLRLINDISSATNKQNEINNADRYANNELLIKSQKILFNDYGILLERKRGEFYDSKKYGYISKESIIDRAIFLRIAYACLGYTHPTKKESKLFTTERLNLVLDQNSNFSNYFFGCLCYSELMSISLSDEEIGNARKSGIFAIIALCALNFNASLTEEDLKTVSKVLVNKYLLMWKDFENYASSKFHNSKYFNYSFNYRTKSFQVKTDFQSYYKGNNLSIDLNNYFNNGEILLKEEDSHRKNLLTLEKYLKKNYLTEDIIKSIQPNIPVENWYDNTAKDYLVQKLGLSTISVNNAIRLITSKELGFYIKQIYEENI